MSGLKFFVGHLKRRIVSGVYFKCFPIDKQQRCVHQIVEVFCFLPISTNTDYQLNFSCCHYDTVTIIIIIVIVFVIVIIVIINALYFLSGSPNSICPKVSQETWLTIIMMAITIKIVGQVNQSFLTITPIIRPHPPHPPFPHHHCHHHHHLHRTHFYHHNRFCHTTDSTWQADFGPNEPKWKPSGRIICLEIKYSGWEKVGRGKKSN